MIRLTEWYPAMQASLAAKRILPERFWANIGIGLRSPRSGLILILATAAAVRVAAILVFPSLNRPDENFQVFEAAHRIAFGYGIKTWEFDDGMRSLLLPVLFARIMLVADQLGAGPAVYIAVLQLLLAALSLMAVAAIYHMGLRTSQTHALVAGLVAATWFEIVYYSFRPLTEAIATDFLLAALALSCVPDGVYNRRRLIGIGFCLGMCLMLRIHLLPGAAIAACWVGRLQFRSRWLPLALGSLVPLYAFGLCDWITWGHPFYSYFATFRILLFHGYVYHFSTSPYYWYLQNRVNIWSYAWPPLLALFLLGLRSSALWVLAAAAIVVTHSLISHKQSSYASPGFACFIIAAAMGSADLVERTRGAASGRYKLPLLVGVMAGWVATSAWLWFAPGFHGSWMRQRDLLQASFWLSQQPDLCGIALYDRYWYETGGYAYLHRNVPIYQKGIGSDSIFDSGPQLLRAQSAYNVVILKRKSLVDFAAPFRIEGCYGDEPDSLCLISRPGICAANPELHPLLEVKRLGE